MNTAFISSSSPCLSVCRWGGDSSSALLTRLSSASSLFFFVFTQTNTHKLSLCVPLVACRVCNGDEGKRTRMSVELMEQRLALIARDFAALYREMAKLHLLTPHSLNVDTFHAVFDRMNMEYLHYAGSSATQPFHQDVVRSVLQLAAAYLSLPSDASPNGRAFGIYLLFFLYATQPTIDTSPLKVHVAVSTLQSYLEDVENTAKQTADASRFGRHVTDGERRLLLALHQASAWHIVPFVDASVHLRTLLDVHEAEGVPLVTISGTEHQQQQQQPWLANIIGGDAELSRQMDAYEAMRQRLGLNGMLRRH